jgi:hypothetical protein
LLKSRRQVLHRRVAEALIATLTNTTEAQPELLAYCFAPPFDRGLGQASLGEVQDRDRWNARRSPKLASSLRAP